MSVCSFQPSAQGRTSPVKSLQNGSPSKCPRFLKIKNWETGTIYSDILHHSSSKVRQFKTCPIKSLLHQLLNNLSLRHLCPGRNEKDVDVWVYTWLFFFFFWHLSLNLNGFALYTPGDPKNVEHLYDAIVLQSSVSASSSAAPSFRVHRAKEKHTDYY